MFIALRSWTTQPQASSCRSMHCRALLSGVMGRFPGSFAPSLSLSPSWALSLPDGLSCPTWYCGGLPRTAPVSGRVTRPDTATIDLASLDGAVALDLDEVRLDVARHPR